MFPAIYQTFTVVHAAKRYTLWSSPIVHSAILRLCHKVPSSPSHAESFPVITSYDLNIRVHSHGSQSAPHGKAGSAPTSEVEVRSHNQVLHESCIWKPFVGVHVFRWLSVGINVTVYSISSHQAPVSGHILVNQALELLWANTFTSLLSMISETHSDERVSRPSGHRRWETRPEARYCTRRMTAKVVWMIRLKREFMSTLVVNNTKKVVRQIVYQ